MHPGVACCSHSTGSLAKQSSIALCLDCNITLSTIHSLKLVQTNQLAPNSKAFLGRQRQLLLA